MNHELPTGVPVNTSAVLASEFRTLKEGGLTETHPFIKLEQELFNAGFALGAQPEVASILNDTSLLCRSESFTRAMDLILNASPITITNNEHANMCIMASGSGFRVAMQEGFSGSDVENLVKTVLSFSGEHLTTRKKVEKNDQLWDTKPDTASVSLSGGGEVFSQDVRMVSFRFPTHFFPEENLSEAERDALEEERGAFVVRHYIPSK